MADIDLDRADLQVVVWEADDEEFKDMLREGVDVHAENAKTLGCSRPMAKRFCHGTNYGGGARTMAINCGLTVAESERMQSRWFGAHPGIKRWHDRTMDQLQRNRTVRNAFGFRRFYFDRIEGILPEALAWVPQSTVANVTNLGLSNIFRNLPEVQLLLQVHDSLVVQYPKRLDPDVRPLIRSQMLVEVPYEDPLVIPVGIKLSDRSWGDCAEAKWREVAA